MSYSAGDFIEFFDGGSLKFGMVTGENKNRLQVYDQNGRQRSVSLKQVAILHDSRVDKTTFLGHVEELTHQIESLQKDVDSELLWESVNEHSGLELNYLAGLYFGTAETANQSAILRALLNDPLRFKWRAERFFPRSPQQVEEQVLAEKKRKEREDLRNRAIEWMRLLVLTEGEMESPSTDLEEILQRIEKFLILGQKDSIIEWLSEVDPAMTAKSVAFEVLAKAGRLPKEADPFLIATGIDPRFPDDVLDSSGRLSPFEFTSERKDFTQDYVFSIDDEDTREIDDAFSVSELQGKIQVGIHITDLTCFIAKNDILDQEAARRSTSIYLPHHTIRMFPERVSCDLASLREGELRPVLTLLVDFSPDGQILNWSLLPGMVNVSKRLTYDEADGLLEIKNDQPEARALKHLKEITEPMLANRRQNGAVVIQRPELKITVRDGDVDIKIIDPGSPSRQIVSELMILFNYLAATYAVKHSVPVIFRSQPKPEEEISAPEGYDPVRINDIFSKLDPSRLSLTPQSHFALGLEYYVQSTSPIRRFTDLVLQRQLSAHLLENNLPYSQDEMMEVLGSVQSLEKDVKSVERKANRQFTLKFFAKHFGKAVLPATVIRQFPDGYLVETDDYFVRGRLSTADKISIGDRVEVKISRIVPERNILVFVLHPDSDSNRLHSR